MNLEDEDVFDEFMRQKLHKIQPKFDEKAWLSLEERLPKPKKSIFTLRNVAGMAAAALLLGAGLTYQYTQNEIYPSQTNKHSSKEASLDKKISTQNTLKKQEKSSSNQKEAHIKKELHEENLHNNNSPLNSNQGESATFQKEQITQNTQINFTKEIPPLVLVPAIQERAKISGISISTTQETPTQQQNSTEALSSLPEVRFPVEITKAAKPEEVAFNSALYSQRPKWQVGLGMSSEVTFAPKYSTRNNDWYGAISIHAERLINTHLRVGIGMNYFQKFQNIDKNFRQNVSTQTVSLDEDTRISQLTIEKERGTKIERLEVPIEIKFMSNLQPRWRIFAASGLTIGVNLTEKQIYESENIFIDANSGERLGSNNSFTSDRKYMGTNLSWNLSAGLEYSLNKHTHIQVIPYFKYALSDTQSKSRQSQTYGLRTVIFYRW